MVRFTDSENIMVDTSEFIRKISDVEKFNPPLEFFHRLLTTYRDEADGELYVVCSINIRDSSIDPAELNQQVYLFLEAQNFPELIGIVDPHSNLFEEGILYFVFSHNEHFDYMAAATYICDVLTTMFNITLDRVLHNANFYGVPNAVIKVGKELIEQGSYGVISIRSNVEMIEISLADDIDRVKEMIMLIANSVWNYRPNLAIDLTPLRILSLDEWRDFCYKLWYLELREYFRGTINDDRIKYVTYGHSDRILGDYLLTVDPFQDIPKYIFVTFSAGQLTRKENAIRDVETILTLANEAVEKSYERQEQEQLNASLDAILPEYPDSLPTLMTGVLAQQTEVLNRRRELERRSNTRTPM